MRPQRMKEMRNKRMPHTHAHTHTRYRSKACHLCTSVCMCVSGRYGVPSGQVGRPHRNTEPAMTALPVASKVATTQVEWGTQIVQDTMATAVIPPPTYIVHKHPEYIRCMYMYTCLGVLPRKSLQSAVRGD